MKNILLTEVWGDKETTVLIQFTNTIINLDHQNANSKNYLHLAAERNHSFFLNELLQTAKREDKLEDVLENQDKLGFTPYHYAAFHMSPK